MSTNLIPADTLLAAKRGFIRTTAQAYSTSLAGGISTTVILSVVTGEVALVPTLITAAVAAVSPLLAGGASFLSILSKGVPGDYQAAAAPSSVDPD